MKRTTKTKRVRSTGSASNEDAATKRANDFLEPIIDGTSGYGEKKRLAEKFSERTGQPISKSSLERWLHKNPKKRQQPLLGNGLILRDTWEEQSKAKRKETK
jgi:hypothetical protein